MKALALLSRAYPALVTACLTFLAATPPLRALGPEIPCDTWEPQLFRAGVADDFAFPDDPASRGAALEAAFPEASWKDFDSDQPNRFFAHTFVDLPPHIVRAQLRRCQQITA